MVEKGRVYGVDLEPKMVHYLANRARQQGVKNLTAVEGAPTEPRLPAKVDLVLLVDTYHHISHREDYFAKLANSLKPGGRVAVIDFNAASKVGPPVGERITPEELKAEMARAGYRVAASHDFLPNQFFIVFERSK
jgi:SAM-dependent methyltransferase